MIDRDLGEEETVVGYYLKGFQVCEKNRVLELDGGGACTTL